MQGEDIFEDGIVVEARDGTALVRISSGDSCEECSAEIFCRPSESADRAVTVTDPYGVHPGDEVRIVIKGQSILKASLLLYGIPLILLLAGIVFGMRVYHLESIPQEVWAFIIGIGLTGLYYFVLFLSGILKDKAKRMMPVIVRVKTNL